jgi:hemolysin III
MTNASCRSRNDRQERKRPDPLPTVFGYHELFHLLVVLAAALQYAVVAFWVL